MSKKILLKEKKHVSKEIKTQNNNFKVLRVILVALIIPLILFVSGYLIYINSLHSVENLYDEYTESFINQEYDRSIEIYRDLYDKTAKNQIFDIHKDKREEILIKIESDINSEMRLVFNDLIEKNIEFTSSQLNMFESFEEITTRIVSDLFYEFLEEYIYGIHTEQKALFFSNEIKKINLDFNFVSIYENQIVEISEFSPIMLQISNLHENNKYLQVAKLVSISIENNVGYIKEYLTGYFLDLKEEMYPILISDLETKILNHKYYTAQSILLDMLEYYESDTKLQNMLDITNKNTSDNLITYYNPVEHLSFRPLIADRNFNFDLDEYTRNADTLMVTSDEFEKILEELYKNNYILIDPNIILDENGERQYFKIPENKKPLIISIEGLNYYVARQKTGNSINLSLDDEMNIVSTYKNSSGEYITDQNGEAIGILNQFVNKNPDFSFDGAKGIISLTGYENIFGLVVNNEQLLNTKNQYQELFNKTYNIEVEEISENKKKVLELSEALQESGWVFASSTYYNQGVQNLTLTELKNDTIRWKEEIKSFTGNTKIILFPHGSTVYSQDERTKYLIEEGFLIQSGIGPTAYFYFDGSYLFMDRLSINGYSLRNTNLSRFFNQEYVYSDLRTVKFK